jgi:ATPase complex subunit ATP10
MRSSSLARVLGVLRERAPCEQARGLFLFSRSFAPCGEATPRTGSLPAHAAQRRTMVHFYELFSKEKREQGRKRLQEEMRKGHFDDFKQLRDTQGKLFRGSPKILPASPPSSPPSSPFGGAQVTDGVTRATSPLMDVFDETPKKAVVLAVAVRDGAQPMLDAWLRGLAMRLIGGVDHNGGFDEGSKKELGIVELSVVDSFVMRLAPFRAMLYAKVAQGRKDYDPDGRIDSRSAFMFTNSRGYGQVVESLENRLIGYVYLLDGRGNIRWRGCGFPDEDELDWLAAATKALLATK